MTSITIGGVKWPVHNVEVIELRWNTMPPEKRPRILRGCERCKRICMLRSSECRCCRAYKTNSGGGTKSYYPDDGLHHVDVMPMQQFIDKLHELRGVA